VPQSQAQLITIGKVAIIDTRRDKIEGVVSRIDPVVDNNTVEIEIKLPASLLASARSRLSVDGIIVADTLQNVTYIKRPAGAKSNTSTSLYRLNTQESTTSEDLRFGMQAEQFIQILSSASAGEQFIISDLSNLQTTSQAISID
jgi:HlyD family secretion protein